MDIEAWRIGAQAKPFPLNLSKGFDRSSPNGTGLQARVKKNCCGKAGAGLGQAQALG
jgi:hypothetical protein